MVPTVGEPVPANMVCPMTQTIMATSTLHVPISWTFNVDDALFRLLGGTCIHCSSLQEEGGACDVTLQGAAAAVDYAVGCIRNAH